MGTEPSPLPWDIWHVRFAFAEKKGYKFRPAIVLGVAQDFLVLAMVTSSDRFANLPTTCFLDGWMSEGLHRPSYARLDRIIEAPFDVIGTAGLIGRLTCGDIHRIKAALVLMES